MTKTVPTQDGSINCRSNVLFFAGQVFLCVASFALLAFLRWETVMCAASRTRTLGPLPLEVCGNKCEHHHCHLPWTRSTDSRQTRSCRTVIIDIQFSGRVCGIWWPGLWAFSWVVNTTLETYALGRWKLWLWFPTDHRCEAAFFGAFGEEHEQAQWHWSTTVTPQWLQWTMTQSDKWESE